MQNHIIENFDRDLPNSLGMSPGKKRIILLFTINKNGIVDHIKVKAPHPKLREESERILKLLPKFYPGFQRGKSVNVKYALPFTIEVEKPKKKKKRRKKSG